MSILDSLLLQTAIATASTVKPRLTAGFGGEETTAVNRGSL